MKSYQIVLRNSIIGGADKVKNLCYTDAFCRKVLSFLNESTRLYKLHLDSVDFYAKCKS